MQQWGLITCPNVESFHGLIFANWDPAAPALLDYMGEYAWFLETRVNPTGNGSELNGGIFKWTMDHNWKFAADNFVGDGYHAAVSHKSATMVGHRGLNVGGGQQLQQTNELARFKRQASPNTFRLATKYGHGAGLQPPRRGRPAREAGGERRPRRLQPPALREDGRAAGTQPRQAQWLQLHVPELLD